MNKSKLIETLHRWIAQRPGLEFANYGDVSSYRSEMRSITKDRHQAEALLSYVAGRDSITAEAIIEASKNAFSGRLTIKPQGEAFEIDYCTGQYWPTEYRKAVCAVLASAVWKYLRDNMPPADGVMMIDIGGKPLEVESHRGMTPGDYLRKAARLELGRPIASRWLS